MFYAEILIGPPGSGKSTYAKYKKETLYDRDIMIINLDPGNMNTGFDYDIKNEIINNELSKNDEKNNNELCKNEECCNVEKNCNVISKNEECCNSEKYANKNNEKNGKSKVNYLFDYDIKTISSTKEYMQKNNLGPHFSVKCILKKFFDDFESFKDLFINKENAYIIIDFPGQVEFLISDDTLKRFTKKLTNIGFYLVAVNLVDIVFFLDKQILLSTYLMSTIAMVLLELPQVLVASKCDNLKKFDHKNIADLLTGNNIDSLITEELESKKKKFFESVIELIDNEGLLNFEILDYDNAAAMMYLQMVIDQSSGFFYNEDPVYEPISKDELISNYIN